MDRQELLLDLYHTKHIIDDSPDHEARITYFLIFVIVLLVSIFIINTLKNLITNLVKQILSTGSGQNHHHSTVSDQNDMPGYFPTDPNDELSGSGQRAQRSTQVAPSFSSTASHSNKPSHDLTEANVELNNNTKDSKSKSERVRRRGQRKRHAAPPDVPHHSTDSQNTVQQDERLNTTFVRQQPPQVNHGDHGPCDAHISALKRTLTFKCEETEKIKTKLHNTESQLLASKQYAEEKSQQLASATQNQNVLQAELDEVRRKNRTLSNTRSINIEQSLEWEEFKQAHDKCYTESQFQAAMIAQRQALQTVALGDAMRSIRDSYQSRLNAREERLREKDTRIESLVDTTKSADANHKLQLQALRDHHQGEIERWKASNDSYKGRIDELTLEIGKMRSKADVKRRS